MKTHTEWLLILDNADDLTIIPEFLPPTYGGHILLTTRAQAMGRLAQRIEVDTLSPEVGALFLLRRAGLLALDALLKQVRPCDRDMALQITAELGGLPLALDQAGAYIEETGCSLTGYQQLYQQRRTELLKERRGMVADHPESVATMVSLVVQRVEQNNPAAAELLRFCAFLAPAARAFCALRRHLYRQADQQAPGGRVARRGRRHPGLARRRRHCLVSQRALNRPGDCAGSNRSLS
jgi:hypothetical protein